jgi:hypothetical protein
MSCSREPARLEFAPPEPGMQAPAGVRRSNEIQLVRIVSRTVRLLFRVAKPERSCF